MTDVALLTRNIRAYTVLALVAAGLACGAVACNHEGPAERAGKKMDKAAEKGADAVEDAGDKVKDAVN
ncbi:MAG: hypothetical protein ABI629_14085 [bacterium]